MKDVSQYTAQIRDYDEYSIAANSQHRIIAYVKNHNVDSFVSGRVAGAAGGGSRRHTQMFGGRGARQLHTHLQRREN